jgi:hypothetical protein
MLIFFTHDVLLAKGATAATIKKFLNLGFDPSQTRALNVRIGTIRCRFGRDRLCTNVRFASIPTVNSGLWDLSRCAMNGHAAYPFSFASGFAISRAHCMKRSTTGLMVLFFNVRIDSGHGRIGKFTGNTFSECRTATDLA